MKGNMKSLFNSKSALLGASTLLLAVASLTTAQVTAPPYRINCGGDALTDSKGNAWEGESHYTGGDTYITSADIEGTDDDAIYQNERWFDPAREPLKYDFEVPNGAYMVRLHMSEIYAPWFSVGSRVFNIAINDVTVAENYDVFAEVGGNYATIKEFPVTATAGTITITFTNITQHAKIDGIEVIDPTSVNTRLQGKMESRVSINASGSALTVQSGFSSAYSVVLRDIRGGKLAQKSGVGVGAQRFNNLRPGVYFVEAKSGHEILTKKVCILP
jgi:hypothetical protein